MNQLNVHGVFNREWKVFFVFFFSLSRGGRKDNFTNGKYSLQGETCRKKYVSRSYCWRFKVVCTFSSGIVDCYRYSGAGDQ